MKKIFATLLVCMMVISSSINVFAAPVVEKNSEMYTEDELNVAIKKLNEMQVSEGTASVKVNEDVLLSKTIHAQETFREERAAHQLNLDAEYELTTLGVKIGSVKVQSSFYYDGNVVEALSCSGVSSVILPGFSTETLSETCSSGKQKVRAWTEYKMNFKGALGDITVGTREMMAKMYCDPNGKYWDEVIQ